MAPSGDRENIDSSPSREVAVAPKEGVCRVGGVRAGVPAALEALGKSEESLKTPPPTPQNTHPVRKLNCTAFSRSCNEGGSTDGIKHTARGEKHILY